MAYGDNKSSDGSGGSGWGWLWDLLGGFAAYNVASDRTDERNRASDLSKQPVLSSNIKYPYAMDVVNPGIGNTGQLYAQLLGHMLQGSSYRGDPAYQSLLDGIINSLAPLKNPNYDPYSRVPRSNPFGGGGGSSSFPDAPSGSTATGGSAVAGGSGTYSPTTGVDNTKPSSQEQYGDWKPQWEREFGGLVGESDLEHLMSSLHDQYPDEFGSYTPGAGDISGFLGSLLGGAGALIGGGLAGSVGATAGDAAQRRGSRGLESAISRWLQNHGMNEEGAVNPSHSSSPAHQAIQDLWNQYYRNQEIRDFQNTFYSRGSDAAFFGPDIVSQFVGGSGSGGRIPVGSDSYQLGGREVFY